MKKFQFYPKYKEEIKIFLLCLILVPSAILIHELGHIIASVLLGFPFVLHYNRVSGLEGSCEKDIGVLNCIINSAAGPLMTLLMGGIMVYLFKKRKNIFFFVFGSIFAGRAFVNPLLGMGDENLINILLKLPPYTIYLITLVISLLYAFILVKNLEENRVKVICATIIGSLVGLFLWFNLIGPLILP